MVRETSSPDRPNPVHTQRNIFLLTHPWHACVCVCVTLHCVRFYTHTHEQLEETELDLVEIGPHSAEHSRNRNLLKFGWISIGINLVRPSRSQTSAHCSVEIA